MSFMALVSCACARLTGCTSVGNVGKSTLTRNVSSRQTVLNYLASAGFGLLISQTAVFVFIEALTRAARQN